MANFNRYMQNFPQKGRGLGHVTPKIFENDPQYLQK